MNRNSNFRCCYQFNWCFIFNITWFVSIFLQMEVILNFYSSNQFHKWFLQLKLFISTPMNRNSNWLCCYHFNWCFIFNIIWFVCIFLTMEVILNFYSSNQFDRSFFATEKDHFDPNEQEFKLALLLSIQLMFYFQYHLICKHFLDNGGDIKFLLF